MAINPKRDLIPCRVTRRAVTRGVNTLISRSIREIDSKTELSNIVCLFKKGLCGLLGVKI